MVLGAPHHRHTFRDYLHVEEMSAVKHEYLAGEIFAMAGGTPEHAALSAAFLTLLGPQLLGSKCRSYSADLRLRVPATGLATYPDAAIVCGDLELDPESSTHVTNPKVVVEVLSPSTEEYDRGEKREHYQRLASLAQYVLVAQTRVRVEVFSLADDGSWTHTVHFAGELVELRSVGCRFAVDDLYAAAGVRLD